MGDPRGKSPWGPKVTRAELFHYSCGSSDWKEALAISVFIDRMTHSAVCDGKEGG